MKEEQLAQLHEVAQAKYDASQAKLAAITAEERRLRDLLANLTRDQEIGRGASIADGAFRAVRGDQAWNSWVGNRRAVLNLQLARLLVVREAAMTEVQGAFGKADVLGKLLSEQRLSRRKSREAAALEAAMQVRLLG
ncbi:hypothetical protein ACS3QZ_14055 [Shimia sp. W99]